MPKHIGMLMLTIQNSETVNDFGCDGKLKIYLINDKTSLIQKG